MLLRNRPTVLCYFIFCVCASAFTFGCQGRRSLPNTPGSQITPQLERQIELVVRAQMDVPANWTVVPEKPKTSSIPGYDDIDIRFGSESGSDHQQIVPFLLSKDRQRLAKLSNFALNNIQGTSINTVGRPTRGSRDAAIEIVDFDDLQCPFCARMDTKLIPEVLNRYNGLVRVVYKDYPLVSIHSWAMHAAVNANCLAAQNMNAYLHFVETVHSKEKDISGSMPDTDASVRALDRLTKEVGRVGGLDSAILNACIVKQDQTEVLESIQEGRALKVNQTPTLFIAGERIRGVPSESMLQAAIDRALKAKGLASPQQR